MARQKINELKDDKQLQLDGKNRAHERNQKMLDAGTKVGNAAIYIVPTLVIVWLIIMLFHYIFTNNWNAIESGGQSLLIYVGGYITRFLQTAGFKED